MQSNMHKNMTAGCCVTRCSCYFLVLLIALLCLPGVNLQENHDAGAEPTVQVEQCHEIPKCHSVIHRQKNCTDSNGPSCWEQLSLPPNFTCPREHNFHDSVVGLRQCTVGHVPKHHQLCTLEHELSLQTMVLLLHVECSVGYDGEQQHPQAFCVEYFPEPWTSHDKGSTTLRNYTTDQATTKPPRQTPANATNETPKQQSHSTTRPDAADVEEPHKQTSTNKATPETPLSHMLDVPECDHIQDHQVCLSAEKSPGTAQAECWAPLNYPDNLKEAWDCQHHSLDNLQRRGFKGCNKNNIAKTQRLCRVEETTQEGKQETLILLWDVECINGENTNTVKGHCLRYRPSKLVKDHSKTTDFNLTQSTPAHDRLNGCIQYSPRDGVNDVTRVEENDLAYTPKNRIIGDRDKNGAQTQLESLAVEDDESGSGADINQGQETLNEEQEQVMKMFDDDDYYNYFNEYD